MNLPYRLGSPTPDGGLYLNEAERNWLAELIRRTDTAFSEISISSEPRRQPPAEYVTDMIANGLAGIIAPHAVIETLEQTEEDEARCMVKKRAHVTIIKGGIPPRPAF